MRKNVTTAEKHVLNNYYREWRAERKEKEELLAIKSKVNNFSCNRLLPTFYLTEENLHITENIIIGSGVFGSVKVQKFKDRRVAVKEITNNDISLEQQKHFYVLREVKILINLKSLTILYPHSLAYYLKRHHTRRVTDLCLFQSLAVNFYKR